MRRILAGIETEYGLLVEGRGAEDQVEDAMALARGYPGERLALWDYRYESPRADLRGFNLDRLAVDPVDMQFEKRDYGKPEDVRSDRVLPNGARLYNDHGHPEYSTPECWGLRELALQDRYGESAILSAGQALADSTGKAVTLYKNNTDFHGASYGTHESYLVPREIGFDRLYRSLLPMLIARQVLTGAGKVGSESGSWCDFQISQRADFFSESANAETLFRRPIFNTRDEAHADPSKWIRLHVICGDANMMPVCTERKVGLVKLALHLAEAGVGVEWPIRTPVTAFQDVSRDPKFEFRIQLESRSWTTAYEILESYFAAAEQELELDNELKSLISDSRALLEMLQREGPGGEFRRQVDWAAKRTMIESFLAEEGGSWKDPQPRSFDLEYHNIDPEEGLFHALEQMGEVPEFATGEEIARRENGNVEGTRAYVRALAVDKFATSVRNICWRTITFEIDGKLIEVDLNPDMLYGRHLCDADDVGTFVQMLRGER